MFYFDDKIVAKNYDEHEVIVEQIQTNIAICKTKLHKKVPYVLEWTIYHEYRVVCNEFINIIINIM